MHLHLLKIMQEQVGWMLRGDFLTFMRQAAVGHWERRVILAGVCSLLASSGACTAHTGPACLSDEASGWLVRKSLPAWSLVTWFGLYRNLLETLGLWISNYLKKGGVQSSFPPSPRPGAHLWTYKINPLLGTESDSGWSPGVGLRVGLWSYCLQWKTSPSG